MLTIKQTAGAFLALCLFVFLFGAVACSNKEMYGMVELFNGKPLTPRSIPRAMIGPLPSGSFRSQEPKQILVMDSGADYSETQTALTYLVELLERYNSDGRGDLPAHYFIDRQGVLFQGRPTHIPVQFFEGDSFMMRGRTIPNLQSLLTARLARLTGTPIRGLEGYIVIMFLGDYDDLLINQEQEKTLFQLLAYLTFVEFIPREGIRPFSAIYPESENPGFYLNNYLNPYTLEKNLPPPPERHRFLNPPQAGRSAFSR